MATLSQSQAFSRLMPTVLQKPSDMRTGTGLLSIFWYYTKEAALLS
jgi:hypothetical protein